MQSNMLHHYIKPAFTVAANGNHYTGVLYTVVSITYKSKKKTRRVKQLIFLTVLLARLIILINASGRQVYRVGQKTGPFLNVYNFAMVSGERRVICQKFANFV